jgi:hypothetical protein
MSVKVGNVTEFLLRADRRSHSQTLKFDVHMSVHRKYISKVQPTRCNAFSIYYFLQIALHVSSSAHHQKHKTAHTASGIVKPIKLPAAIVDEMERSFVLLMMGGGTA